MRLLFVVTFFFAMGAASAQNRVKIVPGARLPREIQEKVKPLHDELRRALAERNEKTVKQICTRIIAEMGPWAGNPETAPRYYKPVENEKPDNEKVWQLWREIDRRTRRDVLWVAVPDGNPERMSSGLRNAGRPVITFAVLSRLHTGKEKEYLELVRQGAEYLLKVQRKNGLFPFPDLRGDHQLFGPMVERLLQRKPEALVDGWIVDDLNGDTQYDNGICGVAMIEAYEVIRDERYLKSAGLASDWAMGRPLSINWNYNAFSVWLLARFARASGEQKYLDAALDKLKVGVLPGQMENGRWFDPHNARLVYHGIIVRGMMEVYRAMDENHEFRKTLGNHLVLALDNAADQILKFGASSNATTTEVFSEALFLLGPNERWEAALFININAGLHVVQDRRAPNVGIYLPYFMRYMEKN